MARSFLTLSCPLQMATVISIEIDSGVLILAEKFLTCYKDGSCIEEWVHIVCGARKN